MSPLGPGCVKTLAFRSLSIPRKKQRPPGRIKSLQEGLDHSWDAHTIRQASVVLRSEHAKESTMIDTGHLGAEATQPITAIVTNAQAARRFLNRRPPDLDEVRQALDCIVRDAYRASDVIYRIRGLLKEAPHLVWLQR